MTSKPSIGQSLLCLPGKLISWLILPLGLSIIASVVAAKLGISTLVDWGVRLPVFGTALTVNSLVDLQWYIFALIVLFGGIWAYFEDRHVTVDFMALNMSRRTRAAISIFGDIFLLLPLCIVMGWYGTHFALVAWQTGEGSIQGGLTAHWLIKGALPVSFVLLGISAIVHAISVIGQLRRGDLDQVETHHDHSLGTITQQRAEQSSQTELRNDS
ncbi:TRAP transporter small permease subunit [uncultured Roseibium sp.]|uniref:TRAP transporter small permease subunit n=1 Tax=uncultured Roseibium sp. TaxID=1936171 RepID=UPI003217088B